MDDTILERQYREYGSARRWARLSLFTGFYLCVKTTRASPFNVPCRQRQGKPTHTKIVSVLASKITLRHCSCFTYTDKEIGHGQIQKPVQYQHDRLIQDKVHQVRPLHNHEIANYAAERRPSPAATMSGKPRKATAWPASCTLLISLLTLPLHAAAENISAGAPVPAMALVEQNGSWQLLPTQLQSYVDEFGALAEIRGSTADTRLNLVDVRLHAGAVPSVLPINAESTCYNDPYEPKVFTQALLHAGGYHLECRGDAEGRYHVQLSAAKVSQTLPDNDSPSGSWQLIWAGDLDRDGKPDLVGEYSVEGGYCQQIMLSADAAPGQLVAMGEPHCLTD